MTSTASAGRGPEPSPGAPAPKLEGPGPKTAEEPRPAVPTNSREGGRREPARAAEKAKVEEAPELEPELDLVDLFHAGRR